ncbi:MAG: response regulator transcription factor [Pseudomonadota bacterium]
MASILFVEDDVNLRTSVAFILEREGYSVVCAGRGEEAIELARAHPPDAVVLDVNLPDISGFVVCQRLRQQPALRGVPVMLVTGRTAVDDVVHGFDCYADDYVTKPFHPRVLLVRLRALLRRQRAEPLFHAAPSPTAVTVCGDLCVDAGAREVRVAGMKITLTRTEFDLLHLFAAHPNRVFSRASIIDRVRGEGVAVTERTVDFQISCLRRKLGFAAELIETIRGIGYKLNVKS